MRLHRRLLSSACLTMIALQWSQPSASAAPPSVLAKTKFDAQAEQVEMFPAIEEGRIEVRMIAKNAQGGNLLITNKEDAPLTVKIPDGFVGVPVLAQMGMGGMMGGGMMGGGMMGGMGGQQSVGGGNNAGGGGGGNLGGLGGGGGGSFFSVPAQRTLRVPYDSVCLEHGKPEPSAKTPMRVVPMDAYTQNPEVHALIRMVATGRVDNASAQAAAWHLSNGMTWQQLASKKFDRVAAVDTPYFNIAQLQQAQMLVATAQQIARESGEINAASPAPASTESRGRAAR